MIRPILEFLAPAVKLYFYAGNGGQTIRILRHIFKKIGRNLSCAQRTAQGKNFELTLTVKMETRHPVEGPFGSEFPEMCNHCGVMTA